MLQGTRTDIEIDAQIAMIRSESPAMRLQGLGEKSGYMRADLRAAIVNCLNDQDEKVRAAALGYVLPWRMQEGYTLLVRRALEAFPNRWQRGDVGEGESELRYPSLGLPSFVLAAAGDVLIDRLRNCAPNERYALVTFIGQSGVGEAVPLLLSLLNDPDESVQLRAIGALGSIGTKEALDGVAELAKSTNPQALRAAGTILGAAHDPRAMPIWLHLLKDYPRAAGGAERWIPDPRAAPLLIPLLLPLLDHDEPIVRAQANSGLEYVTGHRVGYRSGFADNNPPDALERQAAIGRWREWLGRNNEHEASRLLLANFKDDTFSDQIIYRVMRLGDPRAIEPIASYIGNSRFTMIAPNEVRDPLWVIRMLAGRYLADKPEVETYLRSNAGQLPAMSPLVGPYRPLEQISHMYIASTAEHISVSGNLMFVGTRSALEVYDIADIDDAVLLGHYSIAASVAGIHAQDGKLFLGHHNGRLLFYRYSNRGALTFIEAYGDAPRSGHFMIENDRLLLEGNAIRLFDIVGTAPRLLQEVNAEVLKPYCMAGEDGFFCNANLRGSVISTTGRFPVQSLRVWNRSGAQVDGRRLFYLHEGLLEIRDCGTGDLLGRAVARAPSEKRLAVARNFAVALVDDLGSREMSLIVYDIADPLHISLVSHTVLPKGTWRGLDVKDQKVFIANYESDLLVLRLPAGATGEP